MTPEHGTIHVHQCLFGYVDGHRLLASSLELSDEAQSTLLLLSDLAPGLNASEVNAYWTGVPLVSARRYALLRTWAAPEIRRPGCVWSHALIISFSDIARFTDLGLLRQFMRRPNPADGFSTYTKPLEIDQSVASVSRLARAQPLFSEHALEILRAIYRTRGAPTLAANPEVLDDPIFAVWSQQWPRLRRAFSFRTASGHLDDRAVGPRFHLRVLLARTGQLPRNSESASPEPWEAAAIDDLSRPQPTELRRFLWRYGSDIRRGLERFRFLTMLYLSVRSGKINKQQRRATLFDVAYVLPSLDDGRILKGDLAWGASATYSLIPRPEALDTVSFLVDNPEFGGLPDPPANTFDAVFSEWAERSNEIVTVAERAVERDTRIAAPLVAGLTQVITPATFLERTREAPALRRRLLSVNPTLLDSDALIYEPRSELSALLEYVPNDDYLPKRLIFRLQAIDDSVIAHEVWRRFPEASMKSAAERIEGSIQANAPIIASAWRDGIAEHAMDFLTGRFVENARSTSVLAAFAEMLRYDSPAVLGVGPAPWTSAIQKATDDVQGFQRQMFLVFILTVALVSPERGCEALIERAFEPVYRKLENTSLPEEARTVLMRHLPAVYWWQEWDICLRLRIAVLNAYLRGPLDPRSFRRLTSDRNLRKVLQDLARQTKRGRRFLQKAT